MPLPDAMRCIRFEDFDMTFPFRPAAVLAAAVALTACAGLPRERGYAQTDALVHTRLDAAPDWSAQLAPDATPFQVPTEPLTAAAAVRLAFRHNPRVRQAYASLGLGRAELEDARRIGNPTFGYARLSPRDGEGSEITRSIGVGLGDLLLLSSRTRFANGELDRLQQRAASDLLDLAGDVESAWYGSVGADQIDAMRHLVADAGEQSAELAQRFFDAGNINRLQLEQELAAAAQARIAAVRADVEALRARAALAGLLGVPSSEPWQTVRQLPAPPSTTLDVETLTALALDQRFDLAAARQDVALREDVLGVTRRWRWLGGVELGYERETEADGGVKRGPSMVLGLPIFNQGQGAIARADAQLLDARAQLDARVLDIRNAVQQGVARVTLAHDIAERYRQILVPRREAIVERTQEQVNFMLRGVFELIAAKQDEYDAYQEYLEAVRDYWVARAELRHVVGGRLPDDDMPALPAVGIDAILPAEEAAPMDHSQHGMSTDTSPDAETLDPHAGHHMPEAQSEEAAPMDHSQHEMPTDTPASGKTDPHAGHHMPEAESGKAQSDEAHDHDH